MDDAHRPSRPAKDADPSNRDSALLNVPKQTGEAISLRREIREAFHDSKARTIKPIPPATRQRKR